MPGPTFDNGITIPPKTQITDNSGGIWTLTAEGIVNLNGSVAGIPQIANQLLWYDSVIYLQNTSGGWWSWSGSTWIEVPAGDPRPVVVEPVPSGYLILPSSSIFELQQFDITLKTTGISTGSFINYVISGINANRLSVPLTGAVQINNNSTGILPVRVIPNNTSDDNNVFLITFPQLNVSGEIYINDATTVVPIVDFPPTPAPPPPVPTPPLGLIPYTGIFNADDIITPAGYNIMQQRVSNLLGPNINGYGLSSIRSRQVSTGTAVTAQDWQNLVSDINSALQHQTNFTMPSAFNIAVGNTVTSNILNYIYNTSTYVTTSSQRYTVHPAQLTPPVIISSTATNSAWNAAISHVVNVSWPTSLNAQYFFNLGGSIQIDAGHLNNPQTGDDIAWRTMIDAAPVYTYGRQEFVNYVSTSTLLASGRLQFNSIRYTISANKIDNGRTVEFTILFINDDSEFLVVPNSSTWIVTGI